MTTLQLSAGLNRANHNFIPKSRFGAVGIGVMIGLHLLIGYALVSGMARKALEVVKKPLSATIIQDAVSPPPPPPMPKIERVVERVNPLLQAPPPANVPPPDIQPVAQAVAAPVTTAVQNTLPVPAPVPRPTMVAPSSPAVTAPPAAPARIDVGVACPGYRQALQEALASMYEKVGIAGSVRVQFKVRGDTVADVVALTGPREYHRAVQSAVRRFSCQGESADAMLVEFDVMFRAE